LEKTANIRDFFGVWMRRAFEPITRTLQRLHVTPNQITVVGTLLNVAAAVLVAVDRYIVAGIVFLVAGCFDMLDGALARSANKVTPFGAFFDSTLDRFSEGVMLAAIAYSFARQGRDLDVALVVIALLGSLMVSYTRARAESLGAECKVGIMSRPERIVLIALGLFFSVLLPYAIYVLVALTTVTVIQRVVHTYRQLRAR
jgi:CDP-diacylglycerol---glycerol-3-phosphate 3-phosphatidyltransferase